MSVLRRIKRNVAKNNAKKAGVNRACSHSKNENSWFSVHWRSLSNKGKRG